MHVIAPNLGAMNLASFSLNIREWKEVRTCIVSEVSFVEPRQCSAKQRSVLQKCIPAGNFVIRGKTRD